jgi:hypothetical protein
MSRLLPGHDNDSKSRSRPHFLTTFSNHSVRRASALHHDDPNLQQWRPFLYSYITPRSVRKAEHNTPRILSALCRDSRNEQRAEYLPDYWYVSIS